jgi:NADH:ubiquinone oxidoreductase subunit F (NADH-binding)/NADH:ubiquinone oxidoreductase subunit E
MLIPHLREIQHRHGYLPDDELRQLAREAGVPLYRVEEVASFYPLFRREWDRPADVEVRVCRDMTCHLRGAGALLAADGLPALAAELSAATGRNVRVEGASCLGRCDRAPALCAQRQPMPPGEHAWFYCGRSRPGFEHLLRALAEGADRPPPDGDVEHEPFTNGGTAYKPPILRLNLRVPDWQINPYGRQGRVPDYRAVRRVVELLDGPGPFLDELRASGLAGMGGAGALAYGKWLDVWQQPGPEKYIVANGDESEPGTFKDRELLLRLPHLVVEGVILAGLITGASAGYVFIRHEYHEQIQAVKAEIARAVRLGACGDNIFGSGRAFPVEVFESPGGYICGEQSALLEAMEDRRAQPRNRPPELGTNGLRDKPTVVNNVETLAWAPFIFLHGGSAYAEAGWRVPGPGGGGGGLAAPTPPWGRLGFRGLRLFSVSGDVRRPGVFEVPIGLPLGELLLGPKYCGGIEGGRALKAVATSGPSGGLLPAKLPVDGALRDRLPGALKQIRERSPADADFMEWFVARHLPPGATHLDLLAVPLDLNFFRHMAGVLRLPVEPMLGAGLVVYAEGADPLEHAVNFTRFFRNESCGKCVPCRIGSQKLYQLGADLIARRDAGELGRKEADVVTGGVLEVGRAMQQTSICGLGHVAPIPLSSALAYFADDVAAGPVE